MGMAEHDDALGSGSDFLCLLTCFVSLCSGLTQVEHQDLLCLRGSNRMCFPAGFSVRRKISCKKRKD